MLIKLFALTFTSASVAELAQNWPFDEKKKRNEIIFTWFHTGKKNSKAKNIFFTQPVPLYIACVLVCVRMHTHKEHARAQDPGKRKKRGGEKKATVCCSTFEASLSGLAAWSCVSKPHRAFHPLCCPRCVQCTGALCVEGDDTSHSVFCPELGVGVGGGGAIQEKEGDKKQTLRGPQLFKATMHKGL